MCCSQCSSCLPIPSPWGFHAGDETAWPYILFTLTSCVASLSLLNSSLFCRSLSIILLYKSISSFSRRLVSSSLSDMRCLSWNEQNFRTGWQEQGTAQLYNRNLQTLLAINCLESQDVPAPKGVTNVPIPLIILFREGKFKKLGQAL